MSRTAPKYPLPLAGFITLLKSRGFIIGVDHHLRLQAVLGAMGPNVPPEDVKYLLCPVFAASEKQQAQFYRLFDQHFSYLLAGVPAPSGSVLVDESTETEPAVSTPIFARKWAAVLLGLAILLLIGVSVYLGQDAPPPKNTVVIPPKTESTSESPKTTAGPSPSVNEPDNPPQKDESKPEPKPDQPSKKDESKSKTSETDQPTNLSPKPKIVVDLGVIVDTAPPKEQKRTILKAYGNTLRGILIPAPLVIFLLVELYRQQQRRLVLEKQRLKKPPFVWPIKVDAPDPVFFNTRNFYSAARNLRQRLKSRAVRLDIGKTVSAAIHKAGFLRRFHYKTLTRPPEYLFLINLPEYRDHHARFFDALSSALVKEDIFVTRYFFRDDPQLCFNEVGGERVPLQTIRARHGDRRLVIFDTGEGLLDPVTGELEPWVRTFRRFSERAVLTPSRPDEWGMREAALSRDFIVLPATPDGLKTLVGHFDRPERDSLKEWMRQYRNGGGNVDAPPAEPENISELRKWLGEDAFQWLCACAVYPEIHWNLTLHLGMLFGHDLTADSVLKLIRLPWFREGEMPDALRLNLMGELEENRLDAIREAVGDILEQNPPPKNSAAWDEYRLYLAAYGKRKKDKKQTKELREIVETAGETALKHDVTLLRLLESRPSGGLSLVLPARLKRMFSKLLYRDGLSFMGMKSGVWLAAALVVGCLVFWRAPVPKKPPEIVKKTPVNMNFVYVSPADKGTSASDGFYLQETAISQNQWAAVVDESAARICGECPRENMSGQELAALVEGLNRESGKAIYRAATAEDLRQASLSSALQAGESGDSVFRVAKSVQAGDFTALQPNQRQPVRYPRRKEPMEISYEDARKEFKLDNNWQPLEYVNNDFKDNGDGTVSDRATGLMWQQSGSGWLTYEQAKAYIQKLNWEKFAGYDDWRLPTVDELTSLLEPKKMNGDLYIDPVFDKKQWWCWTSDMRINSSSSAGSAWSVYFNLGRVYRDSLDLNSYVRAVRS